MDKKDLSKLKRSELLEIMLAQSEEIDRLRGELAKKDEQLQNREIAIANAGSIAEAALNVTKVFDEAQKAADLYLDNVRRMAGAQPGNALPTNSGTQRPVASAVPPAQTTSRMATPSSSRPASNSGTVNPRHLS